MWIGRDEGGSTSEQQRAKNVHEDGDSGAVAKVRSVVLAVTLDAHWSKADVLRNPDRTAVRQPWDLVAG